MKIEFLANGSPDCPLIRIFGPDSSAVALLEHEMTNLANGISKRIQVDSLAGFESVDGCSLALVASRRNRGVQRIRDNAFEWTLKPESWGVVAGLIEPFKQLKPTHAHQWLSGPEARYVEDTSKIAVVISNGEDGSW